MLKSINYSSPLCEIVHLTVEGAVFSGSSETTNPSSLGFLNDNVAGEDF